MANVSRTTKNMQAMLPTWMKMARDPDSVGAQFLDVFGLEMEDIQEYLEYAVSGLHLMKADISQADIVYKVPLALPELIDMQPVHNLRATKDAQVYPIELKETLADFYMAKADENVAIFDRTDGLVYIKPQASLIDRSPDKPYEFVEIDGVTHYEFILHHIWNPFDEFGLLLGLHRLYGERNESFKKRILDVFQNPGGANKQGLINGMSRELGLPKKHIEINEFADAAFRGSLLNDDGSATRKMMEYVDRINKTMGFTWDNMSWGEAYWKSVQEANLQFDYLPHVWSPQTDAWKDEEFQSGVGSDEDLRVTAPVEQSNIRNFQYSVGLRGVIKSGKIVHPEHSFKYSIKAKGKILSQESKPQNYKYTVVASEVIDLYFLIRAFQRYSYRTDYNFRDLTNVQYDNENSPSIEVVEGTSFAGTKNDPFVEVEAYMESRDNKQTPSLDRLEVEWIDVANTPRTLIFDTQAQFDRNDTQVKVTKTNTITTAAGNVELGFGDFDHIIDSMGDFVKGEFVNTEVTTGGSVKLILPSV